MNIGIDGNEANLTTRVGVGQYAYNLLVELSKADTSHQFFVYLKNPPLADMPPESKNWHYKFFGPKKLWTKIALPLHLYLVGQKLDFFFSPSHYSPHFSPFPTIPTIHDLGYLNSQEQFTQKDLHQLINWTKHSLNHSFHIIAVSEFTKNELHRIYGIPLAKISVVYNGLKKVTPPTLTQIDSVLSKFSIKKPYFLYLGTLKPNKNIPFLLEAFSQTKGYQLVIAGKKGWLFDQIFTTVKNLKLEKSVIFTDFISESEKAALYAGAFATVLPSLYEGFGIPAIESQQLSTPVIVSSIPAFTEVLADSALFIDPTDVSSLVSALNKIQDPSLRQKLISSGLKHSSQFTWQNSAQTLIKVLSGL